jgi:hypothetical protein
VRRRWAALVVAGATVIAGVAPARAVPCAATASLEGPTEVTREVAAALRAHGVVVGDPGACAGERAVKATFTQAGSARGYKLHIEDGFGRTSDRVVTDPSIAVSLIESWTVDEDADLLTVPKQPPAAITTSVVDAIGVEGGPRFHSWVGLGGALANDGSLWAGGALLACGRWGRACVGGQLRALRDTGAAGPTSDGSATRTAGDVLLIGALPLTSSRLVVIPSLGAGVGWLRSNVPEESDGGPTAIDTVGLRAHAAVVLGVALSRRIALALELGGTLAPGARAESSRDRGAAINVPAEPKGYLQADLACVLSP